jgi:hypothetical protein
MFGKSPLPLFRHHTVMQSQRVRLIFCASLLTLSACGTREPESERRRDANTPAGKVGQAAHKMAVEADKAGRVIGRKLDKAAHDAHEGWKEAARKDSTRK